MQNTTRGRKRGMAGSGGTHTPALVSTVARETRGGGTAECLPRLIQ
jgi:hypothetical protein